MQAAISWKGRWKDQRNAFAVEVRNLVFDEIGAKLIDIRLAALQFHVVNGAQPARTNSLDKGHLEVAPFLLFSRQLRPPLIIASAQRGNLARKAPREIGIIVDAVILDAVSRGNSLSVQRSESSQWWARFVALAFRNTTAPGRRSGLGRRVNGKAS